MQIDMIIFDIFLLTLSFLVGYIVGEQNRQNILKEVEGLIKKRQEHISKKTVQDTSPHAPFHTPEEDLGLISSEGVGIVYRPSQDEIVKMNESETVKAAKDAIAQTLREEQAPEI